MKARRSRMIGTAAALSSRSTVMRTISEPARASCMTCFTVASISAVSVLVMDWTTTGAPPPTMTPPTLTPTDFLRGAGPAIKPPRVCVTDKLMNLEEQCYGSVIGGSEFFRCNDVIREPLNQTAPGPFIGHDQDAPPPPRSFPQGSRAALEGFLGCGDPALSEGGDAVRCLLSRQPVRHPARLYSVPRLGGRHRAGALDGELDRFPPPRPGPCLCRE